MCDCIKKVTASLEKERLNLYKNQKVNFILISQTMEEHPQAGIQALISLDVLNRKNQIKKVEKTVQLVATYCPWCGVKYQEK